MAPPRRNILPLLLPALTLLVALLLLYQRFVQVPAALRQLPMAAQVERSRPLPPPAPKPAPTQAAAVAPYVIPRVTQTLSQNGDFTQGLTGWDYWQHACSATNEVRVLQVSAQPRQFALQIQNPTKSLTGVRQLLPLESGAVYRLSARARSLATTNPKIVFGGRVAVFLPPQPEQALLWMSESTDWWAKALVFTNHVSGTATLFAHLGYGNVASTGEFANIALDKL
jgi:hypothetical protein